MSPPSLRDSGVPRLRVRAEGQGELRPDGDYVLYWMIAYRRLDWNFALQRAVEWARHLNKPLLILEALRVAYPWASDRLHRFALDGMREHAQRLAGSRIGYLPYVEPEEGAGSGLLEALAEDASVVVTDDFPAFFLPRMVRAAGAKLPTRLEVVDSNGLLPVRAAERAFKTAHSFRRFLQGALGEQLTFLPADHPLVGDPLPAMRELPERIRERWPAASDELLRDEGDALAGLPIDHEVAPVRASGGNRAARHRLDAFLDQALSRYGEERNDPGADAASGLSPWLHWGHLSAHEVFHRVAEKEGWSPARIGGRSGGARHGWWGMSSSAESFLDELVTWRELGFNGAVFMDDFESYEGLPEWALETLEEHAGDDRPHLYELEDFRHARTHDALWNAAQRQLLEDGIIQSYLRMLWGKKILEWTRHPRRALEIMVELNNRFAIDGRDPNSWSGIFWVLGRYDRGWPERDVFGKIRYMTSESTRRKLDLDRYLARFGAH